MYTFDYLVFIGRFQPFHFAHKETVEIALQKSRHVILALGSAQPERNTKNPFLVNEREQMIRANFPENQQERIICVPIIDVFNDEKWVEEIKKQVAAVTSPQDRVGLIGHFKDESSYYLKLFPEWQMVELDSLQHAMSATPLREAYYQGQISEHAFPEGTIQFLQQFKHTQTYQNLKQKFIQKDNSNLA